MASLIVYGVVVIINTNLAFAEVKLNNAILMPFKDSEVVLVGKVIEANTLSANNTQYNVAVEKYLKNEKPFDLITVLGYGIRKEITNQFQENYFNQPFFGKGDRVFLYLNQKDGQYVISPFSFMISRGDMLHSPDSATIRPGKNNYYGNENITILGVIEKGYMYTSAAEYGANSTVSIVVSNPNHERYLADKIDVNPDGSFIYQFKIKGKLGIAGDYEAEIDIGSAGYGTTFSYIANPLNQFMSGIDATGVKCNQDLQLVLKLDGTPACVKPNTAQKLIERGWAKKIVSNVNMVPIQTPIPAYYLPCDIPYPQGSGIAVLYMPANSTGKICVKYSNSNPPQSTGIRIFEAQHIMEDAKDVTSTASSKTIPTGNSTIVYTLKTGNHAGFYGATIFCVGTPLAVGYDSNSTFVMNDFPWLSGTYFCPIQLYNYQIVGLTGIGVKYIQ